VLPECTWNLSYLNTFIKSAYFFTAAWHWKLPIISLSIIKIIWETIHRGNCTHRRSFEAFSRYKFWLKNEKKLPEYVCSCIILMQ
jgi:hypothetical protein